MEFFIKLGKLDRRYIFILIGLSVLLPLLKPDWFSLAVSPTPQSQRVFNEIDSLDDRSNILISFEYGPSTKPEIHPMAIALLRHVFSKNHKVYITALWPDGVFMANEALDLVSQEFGAKKYEDYVNLGYRPGGEAVVKGISSDIKELYKQDVDQKIIKEIQMMDDINNVKDFDFIFSLSSGTPGSKEWVQYASDPHGIPMSTGCTSIQVTDLIPYVENDQIRGILAGMPGAAEYESLVKSNLDGKQIFLSSGEATSMMSAQSIAHLVIVVFIVLGNITYFLERRKSK